MENDVMSYSYILTSREQLVERTNPLSLTVKEILEYLQIKNKK